ncbi:hypothetical protein RDI58_010070 [Solanum bulbocastanum]|uniref:Uncharacterized protein n=1 Tax=Solanum bulbocastanum TaxID=147425 RepID=A0AAN8YF32_SOLBU
MGGSMKGSGGATPSRISTETLHVHRYIYIIFI